MKQSMFRRVTIDRCVIKFEDISNKIFSKYRRKKISNTDFTIISNNCWGGHVYRRYGLPYKSPTVGLYFYSDDYIKFLQNLDYYLRSDIEIISAKNSRHSLELERKKQLNVPVGVLGGDVEVIFLHYHSKQEAKEKWCRRTSRVNMDNLIVKFSAMNGCTEEHIKKFHDLKYNKKILFLPQKSIVAPEGIVIKRYTNDSEVIDDTTYYSRHIELDKFINH